MKAHLVTVLIVDHDELGADEIISVIEHTRYPNRCIMPMVKDVHTADIGDWHDDHPLNFTSVSLAEVKDVLGVK